MLAYVGAKIKEYEEEIYKTVCRMGREVMATALAACDAELARERERAKYRHKGKRKTVLKTVMGEEEYERAVYEEIFEDGKKRCVYLLDEAMGGEMVGHMSELLCEKIAETACAGAYRTAAQTVSEMTGQTISHTAAWQVVQKLGERAGEAERAAAHQAREKQTVKLLYEEQDGVYLTLQGKDRKTVGEVSEMKIAMAYTGAVQTGKNRFNLTGKVACAKFEEIDAFYRRKESVIASVYDIDEIEMRIVNGDGANWIRRSITDETTLYQLDPFHRNKAIRECVADPEAREIIFDLLQAGQIDTLLTVMEAYANSAEEGSTERENYLRLLTYFRNNQDGLVPYHRRGVPLPPPPEGIHYRSCGAMESNVYAIIGRRMKRRRACWSIRGGNNLASLLALKSTGKLREALEAFSSAVLPERFAEEFTAPLSAVQSPGRIGRGYNGFKQSFIPSSMQWMKKLCAPKPLSELRA